VIGSLRGVALECSVTGEVLLEVGGVGYRVLVPLGTLGAIEAGSPAFLFVHHHVRDDAVILYGFTTREERDTFEVLIGASGVGPKMALAILSVHTPSALGRAVAAGDLDALVLVPGVGKRTAQRLLVELQARLEVATPVEPGGNGAASARADVRDALAGLGYEPDEVRETLTQLPDDLAAEDLLRHALKLLAVPRA
jgi:holliday junction DNA helicase RuvA